MFKGLIITKEELESGNLEDLLIKKPVKENDVTNSYPTLVKFLVASVHCEKCKVNATLSLTTKNLVETIPILKSLKIKQAHSEFL